MATGQATPARPATSAPGGPPARPAAQAPLSFKGFEVVLADTSFKGELGGSYKDGAVKHIPAENGLAFADLPAKLVRLTKDCWTVASRSADAQRSRLQVGAGAMANHIPGLVSARLNNRNLFAASQINQRNAPYVPQTGPLADVTIAHDWKLMQEIVRVNAYTFRGESSRTPSQIEAVGGFHPPVTRTDRFYVDEYIFPCFQRYLKRRLNIDLTKAQFDQVYNQNVMPHDRVLLNNYFVWCSMVETESHHIGRMVVNETLKNYISTSKWLPVAKSFAGARGWLYATRVCGGFDVTSFPAWAKDRANEQEVAFAGSLPWDEVVAFRQLNEWSKFTGPIYLRTAFRTRNQIACQEIYELLSGKNQQ